MIKDTLLVCCLILVFVLIYRIYVVGQNYPVQEVPRPQARKITQSLKMRLQVVAYRYMRMDPYKRLR